MRFAVSSALIVVLAACMRTSAVPLSAGPTLPAVAESQVIVYRTAAQVPGPYTEIAMVTSTAQSTHLGDGDVIKALRKKAAALGATGLILETGETAGGVTLHAPGRTLAEGRGIAIVLR